MYYWEQEITDRDFQELMTYVRAKKETGVVIGLNDFSEHSINNSREYRHYRDDGKTISEWLQENRPDLFAEIENNFPDGKVWGR